MNRESSRCSREELYEQVWSEPMVSLAQKYGLSDVGLRKKCKKLKIPLPPQGYFLRSKRGVRPPLPPFDGNSTIEITPTKSAFPPPSADPEQLKEAQARIELEGRPENRIIVSERLISPHPLIEKTRAAKGLAGGPQGGRNQSSRNECLNVYVSKEHLGRGLRIMDALMKAFDSRGFKVILTHRSCGNQEPITTVSVLGVVHEIGLKETFTQVKHVPPPRDPKKNAPVWEYHPMYDYIPSGRFTLSIGGYVGEGNQSSWSDGKKQRIEDCLNDFIVGLTRASVASRARDLEWKRREEERLEQIRRQAEEEKRREEEKKRVQDLISEAQSWKQSQLIREYIEAVRAKAIEKTGEVPLGSELDRWISWANQLAERLDPLIESSSAIPRDPETE